MKNKELNRKLHENRNDLIGEHKFGDAGQLILFVIFYVIWIVDCIFFQFSIILFPNLPVLIILPIALFVAGISFYLARTSLKIIFNEVRDKPQVIKKGVYQYVRHPMYLAAILLYLSFLILKFSLAAFIVWIFALVFYHYIAKYEETLLEEHLGDDYKEYKKSVPMCIPKIKI